MNFVRHRFYISALLLCAAALLSTPALPQQPQQDQDQNQTSAPEPNAPSENPTQPIPAIRSPLAGINGNDDDQQNPQKIVPDTTPLAGVEPINSGRPALDHNFIQPQFKVFSIADSNELTDSKNNSSG